MRLAMLFVILRLLPDYAMKSTWTLQHRTFPARKLYDGCLRYGPIPVFGLTAIRFSAIFVFDLARLPDYALVQLGCIEFITFGLVYGL